MGGGLRHPRNSCIPAAASSNKQVPGKELRPDDTHIFLGYNPPVPLGNYAYIVVLAKPWPMH